VSQMTTKILAGGTSSFAIVDGRLYAWGGNGSYQLGLGDRETRERPTLVDKDSGWEAISGGGAFTVGIKNGSLYSWGNNYSGQLGLGDLDRCLTPTRVGNHSDWTHVSASKTHTLAIRGGKVFAWGSNWRGEAALEGFGNEIPPTQVGEDSSWTHISAGGNSSFAIREGKLFSWGDNAEGQLGRSVRGKTFIPLQVGDSSKWTEISAGVGFVLGICGDNLLHWGTFLRANNGEKTLKHTKRRPEPLEGRLDWSAVSCGEDAAIMISNGSGVIFNAWETVSEGALEASSLNRVDEDFTWESVSAGRQHFLAVKNGRVYSWGQGSGMRLGLGDEISRPNPTLIEFP